MINRIILLRDYLRNNGYEDDARRIEQIINDIIGENSENAKKRLIAMCHPKYLGDLNIAEFETVYDWWNFLGEISSETRKSM